MAKKTATVFYEDPRADKREAAYLSKVRKALDSMGAPNSGELLHNSGAYVTGVYKAGVEPLDAAAVIWHQHCGKAGQQATPCVAEAAEPNEAKAAAVQHVKTLSAEECPAAECPPAPAPTVAVVAVAEEDKMEHGLHVIYSPMNQAYFLMWHSSVLRVFNSKQEAIAEKRRLLAAVPSEARDSAAAEIGAPIARIVRDEEALAQNRAMAPEPMETDRDVFLFLQSQLGKEDQEVFVVIGLDLNRQLKSYIEIARGQVDRVVVRPEDVVRAVILDNAHGFIIAHNHPSGEAGPSPADRDLTEKIKEAAEVSCPNILFLDHIVVGKDQWYSFTDGKLKTA